MLAGGRYRPLANPLHPATRVFDVSGSGLSVRRGDGAMRKSWTGNSAGSVSVRTGGRASAVRRLRAAACMEVTELEARMMLCAEHNLPSFGDDMGFNSVM